MEKFPLKNANYIYLNQILFPKKAALLTTKI